jgi:hypothetical protein
MNEYCITGKKNTTTSAEKSRQTKTTAKKRPLPRVKSDLLLATSDVNSTDFLSVMEYNRNFTARLTRDIYTSGFREGGG